MSTNLKDIQITFFGSGPVAAQSLKHLAGQFSVPVIITKEVSRQEMTDLVPTATVHTAENKQELTKLIVSQDSPSSIGVIVDFGIIVEQSVIDYFPKGIINSHFSLLPEWRGADPITFTILSGQAKTGVSLKLINDKLDEGLLLSQQELTVSDQETTPTLTQKLISLSNSLLSSVIPQYLEGRIQPFPQPSAREVSYSRKLTKQDGKLDWEKPAIVLEREIRAYKGWPKSYMDIKQKPVIITEAHVIDQPLPPGRVAVVNNNLVIGSVKGSLAIDKLKPAGKAEMDSKAFLAGYRQTLGL